MIRTAEAALDDLLRRLQGPPAQPAALRRADWLIGLAVAVLGVAVAAWGAWVMGDSLYTEASLNLWFQADSQRVAANLLDPSSDQYRSSVHPIFPILLTPWVSLLPLSGAATLACGKAVIALCAGLSCTAMWLALRSLSLPRVVAGLFVLVFLSSAAFLHWYTVIEIAAFNGLSVCVVLAALARGPALRARWWVLASAASLSMTVTNWSAGLAATGASWPVRRAVLITVAALGLVMTLSLAQRVIYPTAAVFFNPGALSEEKSYTALSAKHWSATDNLRSALVYAAVAPAPVIEKTDGTSVVTNQTQGPATAGVVGTAAMGAWVLLLACGVVGAAKAPRPVVLGLGLMIAGQVVLDLAYGELTFLYVANIMPMLALLAACSWFGPARYVGVALAGVVATAGAYSNVAQFTGAADLARDAMQAGGNPIWARYPPGRVVLPAPRPSASNPAHP